MLFGLTNAPTTFMDMMKKIFKPSLDNLFIFTNDILIYSKSEEEYKMLYL